MDGRVTCLHGKFGILASAKRLPSGLLRESFPACQELIGTIFRVLCWSMYRLALASFLFSSWLSAPRMPSLASFWLQHHGSFKGYLALMNVITGTFVEAVSRQAGHIKIRTRSPGSDMFAKRCHLILLWQAIEFQIQGFFKQGGCLTRLMPMALASFRLMLLVYK